MNILGKKIRLRPVQEDDLWLIHAWENNPEFRDITEHDGELTEGMILNFIRNSDSLDEDQQLRLIIHNEKNEPIGALDIFDADPFHKTCGIGILIADPINRNKGYAHDALSSLIFQLRNENKINQLRSLIHESNIASNQLFLKNGFKPFGTKIFKGKKAIQYILDLDTK